MPEAPIVATGIEYRAAKDSGITVTTKSDGVVEKVTATEVQVKNKKGEIVQLRQYSVDLNTNSSSLEKVIKTK